MTASMDNPKPQWILEPFDQQKGWLSEKPLLAKKDWSQVLVDAVKERLDRRSVSVTSVDRDLSDPEILEMVRNRRLEFICDGQLVSLHRSSELAKAHVVYRLRKRVDNDMRLAQKRSIKKSIPLTADLDEAAVIELIGQVAGEITELLVEEIPADILAERGVSMAEAGKPKYFLPGKRA